MPDREKVIKGLECAIDPDHFGFKNCHDCFYRKDVDHLQYVCDGDRCISDALALLKAQEPVAHGRWVRVYGYCTPGGDPVWACSECGKGVHVYGIEHGTYGADIADGQWVSCPNCGAKMDEEVK